MSFRQALAADRPVVTADMLPPRGVDMQPLLEGMEVLRGRVDGINVSDMPGAALRMNSLAPAHLMKEQGFEPILQVTCRDRNRLALQADLLGAWALGIETALILTGDPVDLRGNPEAEAVFELDSIQLLRAIRGMEGGSDLVGRKLHGPAFHMCLGAALDPAEETQEMEIRRMEKKAEAGAEFFQTQPVFDVEAFACFLERTAHLDDVPILAGVFLLESARMAQYMTENIPGITVPQHLIAQLAASQDPVATGLDIAIGLVQRLIGLCRGVHIMSLNRFQRVGQVLAVMGR